MKIVYLIILFIINSTYSLGQDVFKSKFSIYYEVEFRRDSTDLDLVSKDLMVLNIGDNFSSFRNYYQIKRDSIAEHAATNNTNVVEVLGLVNQIDKPKMTYSIFKNWVTNQYEYFDIIYPDHFVFTAKLGGEDWEILDEFRIYEGFHVQKARTIYGGRIFDAWFTEEIPINDGPYVFGGLPGLIVSISDSKNHYSFNMVRMEKVNQDISLKARRKTIRTSREKFFQMLNDFNNNVVGKMAMGGITLTDNNQAKEIQARFSKRNNPLELDVLKK